jgi:hypothetical protein
LRQASAAGQLHDLACRYAHHIYHIATELNKLGATLGYSLRLKMLVAEVD